MKNKIFNKYTNKICNLFRIQPDVLFTKTKRRDIVNARHLLYYVCSIRPMRVVLIQDYMAEKGYNVAPAPIHHGIKEVQKKLKVDEDYVKSVALIIK